MLSRRSRVQVKPNLAKVSKLGSKPAEKVSESAPSANQHSETNTAALDESSSCTDHTRLVDNASEIPSKTGSIELASVVHDRKPCVSLQMVSPQEDHGSTHVDRSKTANRAVSSPPKTRERFTYANHKRSPRRARRKFTGEEELDPKKMRMIDLVYWNPKKEKGMSHSRTDNESIIGEEMSRQSETPSTVNKIAAPQVKIGTDGRLVIDEASLVVAETTSDSIWGTKDEDRVSRKVTSLSFRNRLWRKGTAWSEKETELFYEILRCTGPDFGLMHEFFPTRARNELKNKFNREEKMNWGKLKEVLSKPALLDDDLYGRAAYIQREIEEETLAKQTKKEKEKDFKIRYRKRRREKESALVGEMERENESVDTAAESYGVTRETENGIFTSSDLLREDQHVDVLPNCEVEARVGERKRTRKTKKLSARTQALLDRTIKLSKSSVIKHDEVGENLGQASNMLDGYDDVDCDSTNDEGGRIDSSSSLLVRNDTTEQTAIGDGATDIQTTSQSPIRNQRDPHETPFENPAQGSSRKLRSRRHEDIAQGSSRSAEPDTDEDVIPTTDGTTSSCGANVIQKLTTDVAPPVLIRPRVKRRLVFESNRTMRSLNNSRREAEQLCEGSELGPGNDKGNVDIASNRCGSGILTRSSRLKKPRLVNAHVPEKHACRKSERTKAV